MDLAGFEPAAFTFRTEGSAFASGGDLRSPLLHRVHSAKIKNKNKHGLGGIRTRGLYVANVTIYP